MPKYLEPFGEVLYEGVDVSAWQGEIDFARVRAAGRDAVYIRSGVGEDYVDPRAARNYADARANGLLVGFYHYVTARDEAGAVREARFFVNGVRGRHIDLRLAMDFEHFDALSRDRINDIARVFLEAVEAESGMQAVIYTGAYHARTLWSRELAREYPLWVAEYDTVQPEYNDKWPGWSGFQYSDAGRVDGISGQVDLNRFTRGILVDEAAMVPGTPLPNPLREHKLICVTVQRGDTLTKLAREYDTTLAALARLNAIHDPDSIAAGKRLYVRVPSNHAAPCCDVYVVRRGDTLSGIAYRFGTTVRRLAGINRLADPNQLSAGQTLVLGLC